MDNESYVHIAAVRKALTHNTAAVMIGAGFSRNAEGGEQLKLWKDLAYELWTALNPGNTNIEEFHSSSVTALASQYAQMFSLPSLEDLLKRHIPDEKVKPGDLHHRLLTLNWSEIFTTNYDTLLERSAEDIIERAHYVVTCREDIPQSKTLGRRRIVKLHGSFPSQRPFIFTEEQYRNYPIQFAPFVNLVRQSMLENVFCLIGFSGDDPNFLQWIGWVRDMLDQHALPIYLFISRPMPFGQRKLLEARKITPVLLPTDSNTDESDYQARYKLLLQLLAKPEEEDESKNWLNSLTIKSEPSQDIEKKLDELLLALPELIEFKNKYPGWLICPESTRKNLQSKLSRLEDILSDETIYIALSKKSPHLAVIAIGVYAWLTETVLESLNDGLALRGLELISKTRKTKPETKDSKANEALKKINVLTRKNFMDYWSELAVRILRWSREEQDHKRFRLISKFLKLNSYLSLTNQDNLNYESILFAIYEGDRSLARKLTIEWIPASNENYMEIRKGSLLAEMGELSLGLKACIQGLQKLRKGQKLNSNSAKLLSEESWAALVIRNIKLALNGTEQLSSTHSISNSTEIEDPEYLSDAEGDYPDEAGQNTSHVYQRESNSYEIDRVTKSIDSRISELESKGFKAERERDAILSRLDSEVSYTHSEKQIIHSFEIGKYSSTRTLGHGSGEHNQKSLAAFNFLKLSDIAAIPPTLGGYSFFSESYIQAAWWIHRNDSFIRVLTTALRAQDATIFKPRDQNKAQYKTGWLSRYQVGTIEEAAASKICERSLEILETSLTDSSSISPESTIESSKHRVANIHAELYSRLVIRLTNQDVIAKHIQKIIEFHKSHELWSNPDLWKSFGNALYRSLEAANKSTRSDFIVSLLEIPAMPPVQEADRFRKHFRHDWLNINQLLSVLRDLTISTTPAIKNEIHRLTTSILNTKDEEILEKLWSRVLMLDRLGLMPEEYPSSLVESLKKTNGIPIIPGLKMVATFMLLSNQEQFTRSLHTEIIDDISRISKDGRRSWSLHIDERTLDCWVYLAQEKKLTIDDVIAGIKAIKVWWDREWSVITNETLSFDDIKSNIAHRLTLIDKFLATALPMDWRTIPGFKPHAKWLRSLPTEALKAGVDLWRIQHKHKIKIPSAHVAEEVGLDISCALLGDPTSPNFINSISTTKDWIQTGWSPEPKHLTESAISMMCCLRQRTTAWGLDILIDIARKRIESITESRFKRIEKGLQLLETIAIYRPRNVPYPVFDEDIPLIRYSCCRLSLELSKYDRFRDSLVLQRWLLEIPGDPLPEVRYLLEIDID
ncbi:SIR2 family NAD-dependent protein deacylase [Pseudomonas sp. Pdm06]|uniref:SIR2 family NAD-dependent protein deacylase n=1 Tax=Pseudomonas sp. Pdm06 TaxID=1790044 RepID=UPI0017836585|nr:SIR2 family protein [Pseudomonas sp. Pdm06]MBD9467277.1 SIR2 family protein [Pseudomonas sp. Pdm06]